MCVLHLEWHHPSRLINKIALFTQHHLYQHKEAYYKAANIDKITSIHWEGVIGFLQQLYKFIKVSYNI